MVRREKPLTRPTKPPAYTRASHIDCFTYVREVARQLGLEAHSRLGEHGLDEVAVHEEEIQQEVVPDQRPPARLDHLQDAHGPRRLPQLRQRRLLLGQHQRGPLLLRHVAHAHGRRGRGGVAVALLEPKVHAPRMPQHRLLHHLFVSMMTYDGVKT